ncbi:MAG: RDD family protein [Leptothrix sp. (in: b-proteobacteria)]
MTLLASPAPSAPVDPASPDQNPTAGLRRRLAAMLYEGVLLFGVLMVGGFVYSTLTQQRHALNGRFGLQAFMFLVLGIYFVWFWSKSGQTVAMKTWQVQLQTRQGGTVPQRIALLRYLLSWLWFVPALLVAEWAGWHSSAAVSGALLVWIGAYAGLSRVLPRQQFLHDFLCGTQLAHVPKAASPR